jgi:signal transduction histidine kinase
MEYNLALGILTVLIFITLLVLSFAVLIKLYVHKIKTYTQLIYTKDLEFQKNLNASIIETQELVLTNISRELHDDAGQQLTYINFQLENIKLDSPELAPILDPISQSVKTLSTSVRSISHSLNSQLLGRQNLPKAIKNECARINSGSNISVHYHSEGVSSLVFSANETIIIYRIFQEIINNALKHSKASNIYVRLSGIDGFTMEVEDDGRGFDTAQVAGKHTIGITNIMTRAAIINYSVDIESTSGHGSKISLSPIK